MVRFLALCLLLLSLATPAVAGEYSTAHVALVLDDPLARRIVSTGDLESEMLGPYCADVSIFSVPEPEGGGCRLYVALVDDGYDRRARVRFWRGPVAARWGKLKHVPEYKPSFNYPNPARYLIERVDSGTGGDRQVSTMEIDLEAKPAQLRLLGALPSQAKYLDSQPLEELPMNDSLWLIAHLGSQKTIVGGKQTLRSYGISTGSAEPHAERPPTIWPWESTMDSHLLVISLNDNPAEHRIYFLPMRPGGWEVDKALFVPKDTKKPFVLQMVAMYLVPNEIGGELTDMGALHRVSVDFSGVSISLTVKELSRDQYNDSWIPVSYFCKPAPKPKAKPKAARR